MLLLYAYCVGTVSSRKIERACYEDLAFRLGLPRFRGQVDRSHAMTLRLSIDDQPNQDQAPVHGPAEAGGHCALPQ